MNINKRDLLIILLLLLPTLVLGGLIGKHERDLAMARTWRVDITGYDPRNLLYGHYLDFRIDWVGLADTKNKAECTNEACCLCLQEQKGTLVPAAQLKECPAARHECISHIRSKDGMDAFANAVNWQNRNYRYFVPEDAALRLEEFLRNRKHKVNLDIRVTGSGQIHFRDLYIDGKPWREILYKLPQPVRP